MNDCNLIYVVLIWVLKYTHVNNVANPNMFLYIYKFNFTSYHLILNLIVSNVNMFNF